MMLYKTVNARFIPRIFGHSNAFNTILNERVINFEPSFDDDHIDENDFLNRKIKNQIDSTLLYNPDRDVLLSILKNFEQFCETEFPVSIYPFYIYKQIVDIGIQRIQDPQIISKILTISFYVCSSKEKKEVLNLNIFAFLYYVIHFFYDIQSQMEDEREKQVFDYENLFFNYIDCFNHAILFLCCLEPFFDISDNELKNLIPILCNIIKFYLPSLQNINENNQDSNNFVDFSTIFDYLYITIPLFHFEEDEMIEINNFIMEFLEETDLDFFDSSLLKIIYRTKKWQFNIFNIYNNDIFINYIKNCLLYINKGYDDVNIKQDENEFQNLLEFTKFLFKNIYKINSAFPEVYEFNSEELNDPSSEYFINHYFKCLEKNLKMNCLPDDIIDLFNFSFNCFLDREFRTQKSAIGLIFVLSDKCVDSIYQSIIECINSFFIFIENGNIEITIYILKILLNIINFCNINDQNSFNAIIEEIIQQNVLQTVSDTLAENDQENKEIDDLAKLIDESIQKYQSMVCDS